jgi:16S rRNA G966 N2-methylase RsmD
MKVIQENIKITKEPEKFTTLKMDANQAIQKLSHGENSFDLILLDPPYAKQQIVTQLEKMLDENLLNSDCLVVCETDKGVVLPEELQTLVQIRHQVYGMSAVTIYRNEV